MHIREMMPVDIALQVVFKFWVFSSYCMGILLMTTGFSVWEFKNLGMGISVTGLNEYSKNIGFKKQNRFWVH